MNFKMSMLGEHMKIVVQIVDKTIDAIKQYEQNQTEQVKVTCDEIVMLEGKADIIRNSIMKRWALIESPRKYSAMQLVSEVDLIADYCEDIALLLKMREGSIPPIIYDDFNTFMDKVKETVDMLGKAIEISITFSRKRCRDCEDFVRMYEGSTVGSCRKLGESPEQGYRPEESHCDIEKAEVLHRITDDVGVKEEEADVFERNFRSMAFREELGLTPIQTLHFLQIVDNTDYIANTAKDAANSLKRLY